MPKGHPIPVWQCQEILLRFDQLRRETIEGYHGYQIQTPVYMCCKIIGKEHGMDPDVISAVLQRLRPTTDMAKMYLKAKAMRLVKRVVREANVSEAIDILSRPGIGVLDPPVKGQVEGGTGGFFLSVQAESCGSVKVGVATQAPLPQLQAGKDFDPFATTVAQTVEARDAVVIGETLNTPPKKRTHEKRITKSLPEDAAPSRPAPAIQTALERARERLARARGGDGSAQNQGLDPVQGRDERPESPQ